MTPRVELHPASIKHIKLGHPWITSDRFSDRFPRNSFFVSCRIDEVNFVVFLNDPTHPQVKARVWRIDPKSSIERKDFIYEVIGKLTTSIEIRLAQNLDRDNFYLVFGEADHLPGLHIIKLKDDILIQFYANVWGNFEKDLVSFLNKQDLGKRIWVQKRNKEQEKEFYCASDKGVTQANFELTEYGVNYNIKINKFYDIGIYTDMSAIRKKLTPEFLDKEVLNLYSYTGAYSLYALKNGAKHVTSVDLSKKYLDWLDENLAINPEIDATKHTRIESATLNALESLAKSGKKFDLIICDPPSASSDGKKTTSAIDSYKSLMPKISEVLTPGGKAIIFLNTHSITRKSFEDKIKIYTQDLPLKVASALKLQEDCPSLKGFIEGDYLKGLVLLKSKK